MGNILQREMMLIPGSQEPRYYLGWKREESENCPFVAQSEAAWGSEMSSGKEGGALRKVAAGVDHEPGLCVDSQHIT